jgi:DNA-binding beta-propeller fold protein YncE
MKKTLTFVLMASVAFGAEGYKILNKIQIGGPGGWDYVTLDEANRRLYVSHASVVAVVDPDAGKVVGKISDLHGVHGIAVASDLNRGFITNGQSNSVTIFDLKTLDKIGEPAVGQNPDSVCYEPKTQRILTFNGRSGDTTVLNAKNGELIGTVPLGGKPEFCRVDGTGKVYVNNEDKSEVIEIDAAKMAVTRRASILPCEGPSGLAMDPKAKKLFSVCGNKTMAITDMTTMKLVSTTEIGSGTDGAGFDSDLAFSSNGGDGTLSIVKLVNGRYQTVDSVTTERGGRTMTVDPKLHRVYILAAEHGPTPAGGRAQALPDSFHVLVVGK